MKVLLDTSVIIAGTWTKHKSFSQCKPWLENINKGTIQGCICVHTLSEYYAFLTGSIKPQISPKTAQTFINNNLKNSERIALTIQDYEETLQYVATLQLHGGIIFDALIAKAALKAEVDHLLTLNMKDFERLGADVQKILLMP